MTTVQDTEATMARIQTDLTRVQSELAQLHATTPLVGPIPAKIRDARRRFYEAERATLDALVAGRQALAMLSGYDRSRQTAAVS